MVPVSKGLKFSGQTYTRIHVDRISNLPPDLIGNILSFLPTKEAVATSVLSTKWKWFWTFINRLDFVECLSVDELGNDRVKALKASFISFVFRVLFYRKPTPLNYFGLNCGERYYASNVRAWISAALSVGVKELDLSIVLKDDASQTHVLPSELFCCKSLAKLKLHRRFRMEVPPIVCLPSLQVFSLTGFCDEDSLRRLVTGCPALEEFECVNYDINIPRLVPSELFSCRKLTKLKLGRGFLLNPPSLDSLPRLEVLHVCGVKFPDYDFFRRFLLACPWLRELNMMTYDVNATVLHIYVPMLSDLTITMRSPSVLHRKVILDTPSLRYLKVDGIAAKSLEVADLSQLVVADIRRINPGMQVAGDLIRAVSKVRKLYLSGDVIKNITRLGCELPKFPNMTTLKLGVSRKAGWALLPDFLENAPVLETLVFDDGLVDCSYLENPSSAESHF